MERHSSEMNLSEPNEENHSFLDLDMELEALQSIYINEIEVKTEGEITIVSIDLHPSTADKLEEQYVRMTLQFTLEEGYPDLIPVIKIRNPRGLSDEKLSCIIKDLSVIAEQKRGCSMLFEMIEAAKDHLTSGNRPSGECAICLYGFSENDVFTKTECYHYFHSHCLARYTKNFKENSQDYESDPKAKCVSNELLCPMCRVPIQFDGSKEYPPPEAGDDTQFVPNEELLELQQKMADLYQKQIEKGGIIDVEAEKKKYLLEISNVPTRVNTEEKTSQKIGAVAESTKESKTETTDSVCSPNKEGKFEDRDQDERVDYKVRNKNSYRQDDSRRNRYSYGYHQQNYNNYNKSGYKKQPFNRFDKQNWADSTRNEEVSELTDSTVENSVVTPDLDSAIKRDLNADCISDDISETSKQQSSRGRNFNYQNKYSDSRPRYNRGYRQGNYYGNNSNYNGGRRSERSNFHDGGQMHRNYGYRNEETNDYDSRKNNRSANFKQDFNLRGKYSERNSYRGYRSGYNRRENYSHEHNNDSGGYSRRENYSHEHNNDSGGYSRRENYSHEHNNDSRKNRYTDKDQYYSVRDRNFKERRPPRDGKYRDNDDNYGYNRKVFRNYSDNRHDKPSDESQNTLPENCESVGMSESQICDLNNDVTKNETLASACDSGDHENLSHVSCDTVKSDIPPFVEQCSTSLTEKAPSHFESDLNSLKLSENLQGSSRTSLNPPPGFANPLKKVIYGLQGANPPPGFQRS